MKRYDKFLVLGIIISMIPIIGLCNEKRVEKNISLDILKDIGANFKEADISGGTEIYDKFLEKDDMGVLAEKLRGQLGIKGERVEGNIYDLNCAEGSYSEKLVEDENFLQFLTWGMNQDGCPSTISITSYRNEDGKEETTLFINLIKKHKNDEINDIILKIENIFDQFDKEVKINTCMIGTFDGKLNSVEKEEKVLTAAKNANGKILEKYEDENIVSITAYTPHVNEYIFLGNKKMNLNIAMRYNEFENKTYLLVGTPVITLGY